MSLILLFGCWLSCYFLKGHITQNSSAIIYSPSFISIHKLTLTLNLSKGDEKGNTGLVQCYFRFTEIQFNVLSISF